MKEYNLNKEQFKNLQGLAYWIADLNYIIERYGNNDPEIQKIRDTISLNFDMLDALKVPFYIQNIVICFSENWRQYKSMYLCDYLKSKNIYIL